MSTYNTNLASEFYVLACLHRLGITANLTLGNKKGVDIIVIRENGDAITVEVKGVAKKYDWPANNLVTKNPNSHYVVLVGFEGQIDDPSMPAPNVWVIPFPETKNLMRTYPKGRINVSRASVLSTGDTYKNAWHLIAGTDL